MNRSKFLTLTAASALTLSLAACGDDDSDTTSGGTDAASPGGGAEGASITLMVGVKGDPFYVSMECGATEAADAAGATLEVQGPDKFDATLRTRCSTRSRPSSRTLCWSLPTTSRHPRHL